MKTRLNNKECFNLSQQARRQVLLTALICSAYGQALALPYGEQVQSGNISFERANQSLNMNQTSQRAIVNWQSFSITANESVRLNQPTQGIALFRVVGNDSSQIYGNLTATGSLFLSNPNGVLFGRGAQVDVGSLVATTMRIGNEDFLAGRYQFFGDTNNGVVNEGLIRTEDGGYIALLGHTVENNGTLQANNGSVVLGSAQSAILDFYGDGLVRAKLDGNALNAVIKQTGNISADGGAVQLATNARSAAINVDGVIQANSLVNRNGVIRLEGGKNSTVLVSGNLEAKGLASNQTGGEVTVTGKHLGLLDGAKVDVSGNAGGGTVLIGGDYQGKNTSFQNAERTFVSSKANISADAIDSGDGGKVIVWADDITRYYGNITAKGGANAGNGGFVETSGKVYLDAQGLVDASAVNGTAGQWLLDPNNIIIQTAGANTNVTASPNFTSTNDSAIVTVASIQAALNGGTSVSVTTGNGGANTQAGNITVANAIAKTAGGNATLTLNATNDITFNTGANVSSTAGTLGLTLNAGGAVNTLRNASLNGGTLTLNATGNVTQAGVISGAGTSVVKNGAGTFTMSQNNTYTGATTINSGTLALSASNRIADGSALTVASGATFSMGNFSEAVGSIAGAGNITRGTGALTAGGNNSSTTFSGVMSGTGGFTKTGSGTLTLSGANTYTGTTTVSGGTLRYGANNVIATGAVTVNNGGTYDLNGFSDTIGALTVNSGAIGGTVTTGAGTLTLGGNVTSTGGNTNALISGNLNLGAANRTLTTTNAADGLTVSAVISGARSLTKAGAGTLTLSGANTYTLATNVNAGRLVAANANALGAVGGGSTVAAGATLNVNNVTLNETAITINGAGLGGAGALVGTGAAVVSGNVTTASASTIGTSSTTSSLTVNGTFNSAANNLTITGAGNVTAINAANNFSNVGITSANNVNLRDTNAIALGTSNVTGNYQLQTNGAITQTSAVTVGGTTTLNAGAGNDITLNNAANNFNSVAIVSGRDVNIVDANALTVNASSVRTLTARTLSGDLTLGGAVTATGTGSGTSINLVAAQNFINSGNHNLSAGVGSRWLVYSTSPLADTRGANLTAAYDFVQYNTTFGGTISGTGDGFIYTVAPTVTATLGGSASKTYDGTTTAPIGSLTLNQSGAINGDTVNLSPLTSATYDNRNAGTGKTVTSNTLSIASATDSNGKPVLGYSLTSANATGNVGTINQRAITVSAATDTKTYDGNTSSAGAPTVTAGTIVTGDTGSFSQAFDNRNAGTGKTLTATGTIDDGNGGNNYAITFANNNTGVINQRAITVSAATDTKTYDGNTSSAGAPTVTAGTIVTGDTGSFSQAFDNRNAGTGKTLTATGTIDDGNGGNNYAITFANNNTGVINQRAITVSAGTDTKTYDGNTNSAGVPTVTAGNIVDGDTGNFSQTFDNRNAGTGKTLTATGTINDGNGGNNYAITFANNNNGVINQRAITVTANPGQSKTFGTPDPLPFTYTVGDQGLVGVDTLTGALSRAAGETVGSYAINQGTLAASSNYLLTYVGSIFNIFAPPPNSSSGNPRNAAGLVDLNPSLANYTNPQLFVLNVGATAAGADSEGNTACEQDPESIAKDKDFILMLNYGLNLPKGLNTSCDSTKI